MEINNKIDRINKLNNKVKELKYFIATIDVTEQGFHHTKVNIIRKVEKTLEVNIFASRIFGMGMHISNINVPESIILRIVDIAKEELKKAEEELNSIIK